MAHQENYQTITSYQTEDGKIFTTLEEAEAAESKLAEKDNLAQFKQEIIDYFAKREAEIKKLNDILKVETASLEDKEKSLSAAKATVSKAEEALKRDPKNDELIEALEDAKTDYEQAATAYGEGLKKYQSIKGKIADVRIEDIESAVFLGKELDDSSLNAYENFRSFVFGDPMTFFEMVGRYADAYKLGEIMIDFDDTWFASVNRK